MRKLYLTSVCLLAAMFANAQEFKVGTQVDSYPAVEWIKGAPVTDLDPAKVYIVECWATWCAPCRAAMPHVNELHNKYGDRIVVIGQNVRETDRDAVHRFVAEKGDDMAYRVAYAGDDDSGFMREWYTPAGIRGIPSSIIIKDNRVAWITHPTMLTDAVIEFILSDGFGAGSATDDGGMALAEVMLAEDPFNDNALILKDGLLSAPGRESEREEFLKATHDLGFDGTAAYLYYGMLEEQGRYWDIIRAVERDMPRVAGCDQDALSVIGQGYTAHMRTDDSAGAERFLSRVVREGDSSMLYGVSMLMLAHPDITPTPQMEELFLEAAMKYLKSSLYQTPYIVLLSLHYFDKGMTQEAALLVDAQLELFRAGGGERELSGRLENFSRSLREGVRPGEEEQSALAGFSLKF